jgi:hypothetical protein
MLLGLTTCHILTQVGLLKGRHDSAGALAVLEPGMGLNKAVAILLQSAWFAG